MTAAGKFHQMFVSPHVGGAVKVGMQIHDFVARYDGRAGQVLLPAGGEAERAARAAGFGVTPYRVDRLVSRNRLLSMAENLQIWRRMAQHGPGILHVHAPFVYGAARAFLALSRLKTVVHIHLDFTAEQLRWALRRPPDLVIVCAQFMRPAVEQALTQRGVARSAGTQIAVIRNAIDLEPFRSLDKLAAKAAIGFDGREPLLVIAANLAPHKGQETALRALAALRGQGIRARLLLAGQERAAGGTYLEHLKRVVAELRLTDSVDFLGFRNDIPALLAAADFFLLPSTSEGLPLSILEAQAAGAIVVAAPTAGIPEIVENGKSGFLVPASDFEGYARCIARILAAKDEAEFVRRAANDSVKQNHEATSYCTRVVEAYMGLLTSARTGR